MSFEPRRLTDPRELRALAHPVRIALLEALSDDGPLTATEAADRVGESPSSCSWHLRQLAKAGFIEEAGEATGRRRPWRLTSYGITYAVDATQDPETLAAGRALEQVLADRYLARAERGLAARAGYEPEWQRLTGTSQWALYVTPEELEELQDEVTAVLSRFQDRVRDVTTRPPSGRKIEAIMFSYPSDDA
jgi:predicted ArsR family transcriptional regulator